MHNSGKLSCLVVLLLLASMIAVATPTDSSNGSITDAATSDSGIDSDSNGLYDWLRVAIEINVTASGNFRIYPYLYGPGGTPYIMTAPTSNINLGLGNNSLTIDFYGTEIQKSGVNGSYQVELDLRNDTS
ncbi:MAG: hypothetical protein OEV21_05430, partial [Thermoplasmata archaeon]|nr:hypothetical protein [Thermoplasmata archaeon]